MWAHWASSSNEGVFNFTSCSIPLLRQLRSMHEAVSLRLLGDALAVPAQGCALAACPSSCSLCWSPETLQHSVQGSGFMTFFTSGLLCFLGCCPLAIFPFCCDCTKDWIYSCSVCGTLFGRERP